MSIVESETAWQQRRLMSENTLELIAAASDLLDETQLLKLHSLSDAIKVR